MPNTAASLPRDPETVPFGPTAIGALVLRQPEYNQMIVVRNWRKGDPARCRICPVCQVNPCDTCVVVVPGLMDTKSALAYRFTRGE